MVAATMKCITNDLSKQYFVSEIEIEWNDYNLPYKLVEFASSTFRYFLERKRGSDILNFVNINHIFNSAIKNRQILDNIY